MIGPVTVTVAVMISQKEKESTMSNVDKDTANWRLYGGGGLLVGGFLWLLGVVLGQAGVSGDVVKWLGIIGLVIDHAFAETVVALQRSPLGFMTPSEGDPFLVNGAVGGRLDVLRVE